MINTFLLRFGGQLIELTGTVEAATQLWRLASEHGPADLRMLTPADSTSAGNCFKVIEDTGGWVTAIESSPDR